MPFKIEQPSQTGSGSHFSRVMLSSQTPAQEHFQIRVCSAMGGGRESKGSLAVRNIVLSSTVNSQQAAGQTFKKLKGLVAPVLGTSLPQLMAERVSIRQQIQLTAKVVFQLSYVVDYVDLQVLHVCPAYGHTVQVDIAITSG